MSTWGILSGKERPESTAEKAFSPKVLVSAAAASRLYVDAITKLAKQAQQGTWGGSSDVGKSFHFLPEDWSPRPT
ncbi:hypothetical protein RUM43_004503 [Polyplax serrata]|uniref:Uncharacterized protein n=1 Tax=Polyplax serrata TaxID=468196 RepID=A0AAN8XM01_POLSC